MNFLTSTLSQKKSLPPPPSASQASQLPRCGAAADCQSHVKIASRTKTYSSLKSNSVHSPPTSLVLGCTRGPSGLFDLLAYFVLLCLAIVAGKWFRVLRSEFAFVGSNHLALRAAARCGVIGGSLRYESRAAETFAVISTFSAHLDCPRYHSLAERFRMTAIFGETCSYFWGTSMVFCALFAPTSIPVVQARG